VPVQVIDERRNEMRSRLTKLGAGLAALAALAAGGSALASAGHKTHAAKPPMSQSLTSLPAVSKGTEPAPSEPDADAVQQGDQSAPDTAAEQAGLENGQASESGPSDGPGGYADTSPNADTQQDGEH
jgi:hypothetical protein